MKALKIALLSAAAIGLTAPAFAQTADASKPAVSAQAAPSAKSDVKTAKPGTTVDAKSNTSASATTSTDSKSTDIGPKKSKKHKKHASAAPAKSTTTPAPTGKSSS